MAHYVKENFQIDFEESLLSCPLKFCYFNFRMLNALKWTTETRKMMKNCNEVQQTDVLVIGAGIAGLTVAARAAHTGKRVAVVSKARPGKACNTVLAGGYFRCSTDSYIEKNHFKSTLDGGRMLNDEALAAILVRESTAALKPLLHMGMPGEIGENGLYCRAGGLIGGPNVISHLLRMCESAGVHFTGSVVITDIVVQDGVCLGAAGFRKAEQSTIAFRASSVVLATGGAGGLFRFNDNAPGSYGEGYAMALNAGLELVDMEFTQFYPLIRADCGSSHMLLPAVFADAGLITNKSGEDLKKKYGLTTGSIALVMRDKFSRAIFKEIREGNGLGDSVLMDLRGKDTTNLPLSSASLKKFEEILGFRSRPLKIRPAAHFTMGGIKTDSEGRTALPGLYAVGEVTGGLHGANRLGGNALSEGVVFGTRCGIALAGDTAPPCQERDFEASVERLFEEKFRPRGTSGDTRPPFSFNALREILWNNAGIMRTAESLKSTLAVVDSILEWFSDPGPHQPREQLKLFSFHAAALTARAMVVAAAERTESRGAHHREDFPAELPSWQTNIYTALEGSGLPEIKRTQKPCVRV